MKRSRTVSWLLGLTLLVCAGVIYADQRGMLGESENVSTSGEVSAPITQPESAPATPAAPTDSTGGDNSGYGNVK